MTTSKLELRSMHRIGGAGKQERFTYDFVVDGVSLADVFEARKYDLVGCLDVRNTGWNTHSVQALMLSEPPDVAPDRVMIYVCPECADVGCGAYTVRVTHSGDEFSWSDFRYENDYDPEMRRPREDVGPFRFPAGEYRSTLRGVAAADSQ